MYLFQLFLRYGFQFLDSTTDYKKAKDDSTTYGEKFFYQISHIFLTTTTTTPYVCRQHGSKVLDWHTFFVPIIYLCLKNIKVRNNSYKPWSFWIIIFGTGYVNP